MIQNMPEAEFSHHHNIPRAKIKEWREDGTLERGEGWTKEGAQIMITPAGAAKIAEKMGLSAEEEAPKLDMSIEQGEPCVKVRITGRGTSPRILRGRVLLPDGELGERASVRILYPKATAKQFRLSTELECIPTSVDGIYTYAQKPDRRVRI